MIFKYSVVFLISIFSFTSAATEINVNKVARFALGTQISQMQGYDIRARRITVKPGATIDLHEHSKTPGIVYVVSGSIKEIRNKVSHNLIAGDMINEDATTIHGWVNNTKQDCILLAFDLPKSH